MQGGNLLRIFRPIGILEFEIMVPYCKKYYLLGLVDGVRHGEEGAVGENGQHDKVVEILID